MRLTNQQGSVVVVGLIFVLFMSIVLAGLAFATVGNVKIMGKNKNAVQSQYAAEAGAIRAKSGILNGLTEWSWLGSPQNIDETKKYTVTITPEISGFAQTGAKYTIKSVGEVDGIQKTVIITVSAGTSFPYAAYGGNSITVNAGVKTDGTIATGADDSKITNNSKLEITIDKDYKDKIPTIPNALMDPDSYTSAQNLDVNSSTILSGDYYMKGTANLNNGIKLQALNGNNAVIYVDGTFNISGDITTDENTTLTIISDKDVNINSGSKLSGNIKIYATQDIRVDHWNESGDDDSYTLLMSNQNIYLNSGVHLSNIVAVAQKNMYVNDGVKVNGCVMAARELTLNSGCTITYDANVLSNWGI